ncbi:AgmX/PglI C-terminal domain-containing protein [Pendulispora rubella]|uniref:AgmX/PglI C-terminal domain-containing protein n=1 Tax=Pendulispora rubella TaxID=2741070 RepID=A0ABZ2KX40_9BACT
MSGRLPSLFLIVAALSACGGSPPPPAPPPPEPAAAPPEPPAPAAAEAPKAEEPLTGKSAAASDGPPAPTEPSVAGTVTTGSDVPDECSKAALPYEEKVRPLLNKCYQEGKKKNPDLSGTVRVQVAINTAGKVTSVKPSGTSELGDSVVQCMVKAVRDTPFDGALCKSKTVIVSKTYGKK